MFVDNVPPWRITTHPTSRTFAKVQNITMTGGTVEGSSYRHHLLLGDSRPPGITQWWSTDQVSRRRTSQRVVNGERCNPLRWIKNKTIRKQRRRSKFVQRSPLVVVLFFPDGRVWGMIESWVQGMGSLKVGVTLLMLYTSQTYSYALRAYILTFLVFFLSRCDKQGTRIVIENRARV